jgi:hypothetical protein
VTEHDPPCNRSRGGEAYKVSPPTFQSDDRANLVEMTTSPPKLVKLA